MTAGELRRADEEAVLKALRRMGVAQWAGSDANATLLYGWSDSPKPNGLTVKRCQQAARRLEARGELVGVPGSPRTPRAWRLP